jgi:nitroreductase
VLVMAVWRTAQGRARKGRRSNRQWRKDDISDELLKKAVELATWAPNGGNYQGWHFIIVKKKEIIEKIAKAVQSVADQMASWSEACHGKRT